MKMGAGLTLQGVSHKLRITCNKALEQTLAKFDLVIRGGMIADGSGGDLRADDVAVVNGRIVAVAARLAAGREEIDAKGRLVTPGFVDLHTHYDGHVTWEDRFIPSCDHGVTTVVMGNCGVGFAPCRPGDRDTLMRLMAGVEDIPEVVMTEGMQWNWETFPEYLDVVAARNRDMDVVAQIPHSALRVYVMGQRALNREPATTTDIAQMAALAEVCVAAGALGFATSRALHQKSSDGQSIPSVQAEEAELHGIASALTRAGGGVLQMLSDFREGIEEEFGLMRRLVEESGRPLSYTLHQKHNDPEGWRRLLELMTKARADGLPIRGQVIGRPTGVLFAHNLSFNPFSGCPSYLPLSRLPMGERIRALQHPDMRARLIAEDPLVGLKPGEQVILHLTRDFEKMFLLGDPPNYEPDPDTSIASQARRRGIRPAELAYDLLMQADGRAILFLAAQDYEYGDLEVCRTLMQDPNTILGLGDAGAHCGLTCDASFPTYMLTHWTRDRTRGPKLQLPWVIKALAADTAAAVGLHDRGRIGIGYKADLNVIDYDRLRLDAPELAYDLPANGRRLVQHASGYEATVVSGKITYRHGQATGEMPGRLVRGAQTAPNLQTS